MLLHGSAFLLFLAVVAIFYFAFPTKCRKWILILANLGFLLSFGFVHAIYFVGVACLAYFAGALLCRTKALLRRLLFFTAVVSLIGFLFFIKQKMGSAANGIYVLSYSFIIFPLVAFLADIQLGKLQGLPRFSDFLVFSSFFPTITAGPVIRPHSFLPQIEGMRGPEATAVRRFVDLFTFGLLKKILIADQLASISDMFLAGARSGSTFDYLIFLYSFLFRIYFDFSGYTDMARSVAILFGFQLPENFRSPLFAENPIDFWRRWHISLAEFFRDYIYYPIFFRWKNIYFAAFAAMLLNGIWHGLAGNYAYLGLFWGLVVCGYLFSQNYWDPLPRALRIFLMFHIFLLSFVFFHPEGMELGPWKNSAHFASDINLLFVPWQLLVPGILCLPIATRLHSLVKGTKYYFLLALIWLAMFFYGSADQARYLYSAF